VNGVDLRSNRLDGSGDLKMKLFGTDGIRGVANQAPLTPATVARIGQSAAGFFDQPADQKVIVIGKDTRASGDMLEAALSAGICSAGGNVVQTGVLPTPGIAWAAKHLKANAGIVISASHNPYHDNGIKFFDRNGCKLTVALEEQLEASIQGHRPDGAIAETEPDHPAVGTIRFVNDLPSAYAAFLKQTISNSDALKNFKIVIDCANGAVYRVAPTLFTALGMHIQCIGVNPNGTNINADCGSEHTDTLQQAVVDTGADAGLAFDGDGDRLIAIDEKGRRLSGDHIMAICAIYAKDPGVSGKRPVVSTIMSNRGLTSALTKYGIGHIRTQVGDRHVMHRMLSEGALIGGEESGHLIFSQHHSTGDGLLAALRLLEILADQDRRLSELSEVMTVYPQIMVNVPVSQKPPLGELESIVEAIKAAESELSDKGRVLIRYSGTQPLCRVMVESEDRSQAQQICRQLSVVIEEALG
jgi:phosphoglucosamine mutase